MALASRTDDLRFQNRSRVLSAVRSGEAMSRKEIGELTGLSAATVSAITSDFIEEGVLMRPKQNGNTAAGRGRPKVALAPHPAATTVCSLYFQVDRVTATLVDYAGNTFCEHDVSLPALDHSAHDIKQALIDAVEGVLANVEHPVEISVIAVGFQGVTDVHGTTVLWTPICSERNMPVAKWLSDRFSVPVKVANDCDMIARGVHGLPDFEHGENFAVILLAHGVGMGLFLSNTITNGTRSSGFEFGHMNYMPNGALCRCGNKGCIEAYAGDYALARRALGRKDDETPVTMREAMSWETLDSAIETGDKNTLQAFAEAGSALGTGIASLFALMDPFPIVLVGRGTKYFSYMEQTLRQALNSSPGRNQAANIEITCIANEEPLVRYGCAMTALQIQDEKMARQRPAELKKLQRNPANSDTDKVLL